MLFNLPIVATALFVSAAQGSDIHKRGKTATEYKTATAYQQSTTTIVLAVPTTTSFYSSSQTASLEDHPHTLSLEDHPYTFSSEDHSSYVAPSSVSSSSTSRPTSDDLANSKGITYSPYSSSGACKSLDEVKSDLKQLAGYSKIRIYDTDCNQVENVLQAKADHQKLLAGIFYPSKTAASVKILADAVEKYGSWDDIFAVSVGNELVNDGSATPSTIKTYVSTAKSALKNAGYSGNVVSVDTYTAVLKHPELCGYSDFVAVNAHGYFNSTLSAANAGTWLNETIHELALTCNTDISNVWITESGWPSSGDTNGKAIASSDAQEKAISSITSQTNSHVFLFTAFNDYWKSPGYLNVEQSFGIHN